MRNKYSIPFPCGRKSKDNPARTEEKTRGCCLHGLFRCRALEIKGCVDLADFLILKAEVSPRDGRGGMGEDFGELDQRPFRIGTCHFNDVPAESFPVAVACVVLDVEAVFELELPQFLLTHSRE